MSIEMVLNTYEYWPDMKKIEKDGSDQLDFIALAFEACLNNTTNHTSKSVSVLAYLLVDYYEKEANISFNIVGTDECGTSCLNFIEDNTIIPSTKNRASKAKHKDFEFKQERLRVYKKHTHTLASEPTSLEQVLSEFRRKHVYPEFKRIVPFLDRHHIHYREHNLEEMEDFFKITRQQVLKTFSEKFIKTQFPEDTATLMTQLLHAKLEQDCPTNNHPRQRSKI